MQKKAKKRVPRHRSEGSEREFWASSDSTDYVDRRSAKRVAFPNLHPSTRTISLRLPEGLLADLKILANKKFPRKLFTEVLFLYAARTDRLLYDFTGQVFWAACRRGRTPPASRRRGPPCRPRRWTADGRGPSPRRSPSS